MKVFFPNFRTFGSRFKSSFFATITLQANAHGTAPSLDSAEYQKQSSEAN
jgi:hypothetical protein